MVDATDDQSDNELVAQQAYYMAWTLEEQPYNHRDE
jgi:hypothetical protein